MRRVISFVRLSIVLILLLVNVFPSNGWNVIRNTILIAANIATISTKAVVWSLIRTKMTSGTKLACLRRKMQSLFVLSCVQLCTK